MIATQEVTKINKPTIIATVIKIDIDFSPADDFFFFYDFSQRLAHF
jgi:hypothetical protein